MAQTIFKAPVAGQSRRLAVFVAAMAFMTILADPAYAQSAGGNTDLSTILQNAVNIITGTTGKVVCIGIVGVTGILTAAGACSMHTLGRVALGIGILFSAAWLVGQLLGS